MIWSYQLATGGYLTLCVEEHKSGFMLDVAYADLQKQLSNMNLNNYLNHNRQRVVVKYGCSISAPYFSICEEKIESGRLPRLGDTEMLWRLISCSKEELVFYTGAGISRASGIWGTKELLDQLYIKDLPVLTRICIEEPKVIMTRFMMFLWRIKFAKPTAAHLALARLLDRYNNNVVVTENIDMLHQKSGVKAHLALGNKKLYSLRPKHVITLGLSCPAEVGLLQFWKLNGVTIHCVAMEPPECLHLVDYLYLQDVQQLLPKWERDMEEKRI
ncbi:Sir2 family NAD-dependent protein deacetylase [Paenibacillus sp. FSL M7-0420]|uniref:Sir2 family NAD-dependent protein deacetylase n=1 Tax=Paenibacillus sp. FSL M7-0420 TaxID=2921609 RepID=UPI0030F8DDB6